MPKAVVELRADSKQFQASMKNAAGSLKTASRTMQANWAPISRTLKRIGIGVLAIGTAAVVMAAKFDKGVAEITTLMGDVAPAAVKQMSDEMRTLSVESGQAIDKLVKARYDIVSAGFTGAGEGAELLNVAVKTAIGGVSDVATTADILTTALNSYQLSADNAANVSDILFTTVRLGKTTMDELGESLGMVLPISNAAKVSLEDVGAAMATITASGLNTRIATTALRGAIDTLSAPTKEARAAMEEFGLEVKRNQDGTMDFLNTIRQFQGLSPDVVSRIIPDRRARVAVLSMANNFEKLQDNVEQFKDTAGATDEAVRKMSETFSFKLNQATATFKDIMIEIGTAALPPLIEALGKLRNMMPEIREQVTKIATGFGELVYWIVDHVDLAVKLIAVAVAFKAIGLAINTYNLVVAIPAIAVGVAALAKASILFVATPIGAAVAAVAVSVGLLAIAMKKVKGEYESIGEVEDPFLEIARKAKEAYAALSKPYQPTGKRTIETPAIEDIQPPNFDIWWMTAKEAAEMQKQLDQDMIDSNKAMWDSRGEALALSLAFQSDEYSNQVQQFAEDNMGMVENFQEAASQLMNISNTLANYQIQESQRVARESINAARNTASEKIKAIQTSVKKEVLTEQQGADQIAIIEAGLNTTIGDLQQDAVDRENEIRRAQKPYLIAEAIANTAVGFTQALRSTIPPWNFILAGLVAAAGAAQVSTIASQKFASGGDFTTSGQRTIIVGDNPSGKERVKITPSENSDSFDNSGGDTYKVYIYANDPRSFEDYINTSGKKPLINFIKETTKRREL